MSAITLKAHFDEPVKLAPNTPVRVVAPQPDAQQKDRAEWFAFARDALVRTHGHNEPDYSAARILERSSE